MGKPVKVIIAGMGILNEISKGVGKAKNRSKHSYYLGLSAFQDDTLTPFP